MSSSSPSLPETVSASPEITPPPPTDNALDTIADAPAVPTAPTSTPTVSASLRSVAPPGAMPTMLGIGAMKRGTETVVIPRSDIELARTSSEPPPPPVGTGTVVMAAPTALTPSTPPASMAYAAGPRSPSTPPRPSGTRVNIRTAAAIVAMAVLAAVAGIVGIGAARARRGWMTPFVLASSDARVTQAAREREQLRLSLRELDARNKDLASRQAQAKSETAIEEAFQRSFEAQLRYDIEAKRAEVKRLHVLSESLIDAPAGDTSDGSRREEVAAQIATARRRLALLEQALGRSSNYESLALRREYDRSKLVTQSARGRIAELARSLEETSAAIDRQQRLLAAFEATPYVLAIDSDATLAFLPLEEVPSAESGSKVLACRPGKLLCREVGTLERVLPGEVHGRDPFADKDVKGQLAMLSVTSPEVRKEHVLYLAK
jgi:hypothetical protein